jgi:chromosome partitioning protein
MANEIKYVMTTAEFAELTGEPETEVIKRFDHKKLLDLNRKKVGIPSEVLREDLAKRGFHYSFKVVAHINMRGGIGKTTSTITVASRAFQYGFRTCILDLDPQGSSSMAFGTLPEEGAPIFYDIWQNPSATLMPSLKAIEDNLYILPSSLENGLLDLSLINPSAQKKAVHGVCAELKTNGFDLVMIDCPPSLGTAVISTICAADIIVIPVCSDPFSFKGLELTLNEITSICETFHLERPAIRILCTKFDRRERISIDALEKLSNLYGDYFVPTVIRTSTEFSKAIARRETVFASLRRNSARDDYDMYVRHLLELNNIFKKGNAYGQEKENP